MAKYRRHGAPGRKRSAPLIEEFEPRLLLSADPVSALVSAAFTDYQVVIEHRVDDNLEPINSTPTPAETEDERLELVFVDTDTPDYRTLIDDLLTERNDGRRIDVILLDNQRDGVTQVTETLQAYSGVNAIHIISHGDDGVIDLGSTQLTAENLAEHEQRLTSWSQFLNADADILVYGCNLAASEKGEAFIDSLARLTEADVAASDDLTGNHLLGGDWNLEYHTGSIESDVTLSANVQQTYESALALFTVNTLGDSHDANPGDSLAEDGSGNTSLRAAIEEANILGGADSISLGVGSHTVSLGEITISSDITITGAGVGLTVIDAGTLSRVFNVTSGTVTLSGLTIQGGDVAGAGNGGALDISSSATVTLNSVVLTGNTATRGGAIYNLGTLNLTDVTIDNNTATADAGAIFNRGTATLNDVTISNNSANSNAGAIWTDGNSSSLDITNATVSGNSTPGSGGGLYVVKNTTLTNVTITNNSAAAGAAIHETGGPVDVTLTNSIVAGNIDTNDVDNPDLSGNYSSGGHNLVGNKGSASLTANTGDQIGTAGSPIDPLLGALADNGGPTMTHALLAGSTAIDGGDTAAAPVADQRGTSRSGTADIGAYEYTPVNLVPLAVDDSGAGFATSEDVAGFVTGDVLANDDLGNTPTTVTSFDATSANGATVAYNGDGTFTYTPVADFNGNDTFTYTITDADSETSVGTVTIAIAAVNDAPTLDNTRSPALDAQDKDAGPPSGAVGTLVSALVDFAIPAGEVDNVTDPDNGALLGIAVTAADTANGSWFYTTDNGATPWVALGAVSESNALLLAADNNTRLYFQPNPGYTGTVTNAITFLAWDQTSGTNGGSADVANIAATVLDDFSTVSWNNNSGSANWSAPWVENEAGGAGPDKGNLQVKTGQLLINASVIGDNLHREADLSGATAATLSYFYDTTSMSNGEVELQVSGDGGLNYDTWRIFNSTDSSSGIESIDISSYIGSNTTIRFFVTDSAASNRTLYIDDLEISYSSNATGGDTAFSSASDTASITVNTASNVPAAIDDAGAGFSTSEDVVSFITGDVLANDDLGDTPTTITSFDSTSANGGTVLYNGDGTFTYTPLADFNGNDTFTYTITDADSETSNATVTIAVSSVDDGLPVAADDAGAGFSTSEDVVSFITGNVLANDTLTDHAAVSTFDTISANGGAVAYNGDGTFTYTPVTDFNGNDTFTYTLTDDEGQQSTATVTINVTPVNDGPAITSTAGTTATEDTLYTYTATVNDPDDANNGTDLTWSLSGEPAGMVVSSTGVVTWTPLEGVTTSGAVTLTVSDGNEDGAVDATEVFTITVTPVNDAPTITSTAGTTATEDTLYTYTATVSDPDDANNGTDLTWSLSGAPTGMVVSSTGVVTWTPAEGVTSSGPVTLTVSDGNEDGAVDATEVFTITVTPVNDAPTITSTAPTTATEDTLYTYTATVSDPDDANNGTDLTWSLSGAPAGMVVSSTGVVTWTPLEGVTTSGAVTLTVSDGNEDGAVDATEVFTVTVTPVNDAPAITSTAGTAASEGTLYTYTATVSDPDDANNGTDLTWSLSGAPAGMVVSSTGVVTWTPAEGVTTSGAVTLTVSDGNEDGAVDATEVFTITVAAINNAPTITSTAGTTATEDTLYTYTATVSDPDDANNGTDLTWSLSGEPAGMVVSSTGVVTWTPLEGVTTSGAVTLTVSDGNEDGAVDATEVFTITVTPVNDAPTLDNTQSPALTAQNEDSAAPVGAVGTLVSSLVDFASPSGEVDNVTDPDSGALLGIAVTAADTANGSWYYTIDNGATPWIALGAVSDSNALLLAADNDTRLYFQPNTDYNGTLTNAITFHAWDQTAGTNGGTADLNAIPETLLDNFNVQSYSNNDGTQLWTGNWIEILDNNDATSGTVKVSNGDELQLSADLVGEALYRDANLSTANSATLSFAFDNGLKNSKQVEVQISDDGGDNYTTVAIFDASTNTATGTISHDISDYMAANTRVQFLVTATGGGLSAVRFDDVQIEYSTGGSGGASAFSTAMDTASLVVNPVNDAPTITSTAPTTATEETLYTYTATVSDPDDANNGTDLTWSLSGEPAGMVVSSTGVVTWTPAEGVTTSGAVTLTVSDGNEDGAVDATEVFTITVTPVNDAPTITSTAPTTATEDTLYTYTATVSDPDDANNGTDLTWSLSGEPAGMVVSSTGVVTWTPLEGVTTSGAVTLTVSDGNEDGAVDATEVFTITVTPVNDAPTITSTAGTAASEGTLYTYTATVNDPDDANNGTDLTWSLSGEPAGMVVSSTGVVTWTPAEGVTTSGAVTLTVSDGNEDGAVDATEVFTITVAAINNAPTITSTAGTTATENTLYTYTATVSDPDDANNGTDLTWSLSGEPAGMVVSSTGVVTWTPLEGVTTSGAVTLTVSDGNEDGAVDATEVFTITVTPVNDAPTITSTAGTTATEDTLYTYTATVSDPDDANNGTDLTWSLSGEPAGMVVSSTGVVTWTPAEGVTTSGAVTLTVSDGNEDGAVDATEVFTITVTPVNDAPTITSTAGTTATEDTLYTYTATVSDPDDANNGTDLTWSLSGEPAGMVVSSTGVVTWTPTEGVTTSGAVTLTVSDGNEDGAVDATEVFTITVTPVNDAPQAATDAAVTDEGTPVNIDVLDNDTDAEGDPMFVIDVGNADNGTVVNNGDGTVTYTPDGGFTGADSFVYLVSDLHGLTSYWALDGDATDSVGGNNGTITGTTTVAGAIGDALSFDKVDDRVVVPNFAINDSFSLSFQIKVDDNSGADYQYIYSHGPVNNANSLNIFIGETGSGYANMLYTQFNDSNDIDDRTALEFDVSSIIGDGEWHTYTLTVETGSGSSVYLDGTLQNTDVRGGDSFTPTTDIYFGGREDLNADRFFGGSLDSVHIFDRALDASEVSDVHTGGTSLGAVNITVNNVPVANDDSGAGFSTTEDVTSFVTGNVLTNDDLGDLPASVSTFDTSSANSGTVSYNGDGTFTYTPDTDFNGSDTFTYTISDADSETSTATVTISVSSVNDAPTVTSTAGTTATEDTLYTYTATVSDPDDANNGTDLTWSLSGEPAGMVVSSTGVVTWTPLEGVTTSGAVTLTVSDGNEDGAVDATEVFTITVTPVNDAPTITSTAGTTATEDTLYTYTATVSDPDDANNGTDLTWSLSGEPAGMVVSSTGVVTWTPAEGVTTSGAVTLTVSDGNEDGAVDATEVFTITVTPVNDAPTITSTAPTTATEDTLYTYTATVSDPDDANNGTDLTWSLSGEPAGMVVSSTGVVTWTPLEGVTTSGAVTLTVSDGNEDGAVDATEVFTITVTPVNDAPTITSTAGTAASEGTLYTYTATVNDPDDANNGTDLTWSLSGEPAGMVVSSTGVVTWTPAEGVTTSGAVTLTVSDGNEDGAVDATEVFTITVAAINNAPTITSTAGTTATENTLYTYTATVSDPDDANNGTDLTWSLSGEPAGMVVSSTGVVTWTPLEGVTTSGAVTLTVSDGNEDGAVDATEVFTITVTPVNDAPTITSTAGTTATEDTLYTYTATVSDPDDANNGTDLTWSLSGEPAGMVVSSTGVVTWTPAEGVTTSGAVTLTVSDGNEDGAVDATEVFTITVTPVNDAPTITSTAGTTATEDTLYTYTATVSDPDDANNGTDLTWSLSGEPAGMVVSSTGVVTWTPTEGVTTSGAVTLTVSDGNEDGAVDATEVFTITVTPVNDAPTITSTAPTTATEDTLYTYTATVSDPDDANNGTDLTWSLSGEPAGMVVSSTGVVTWTPLEGVTTSGAVTLTVSDGNEDGAVDATEVFTITVTPVNDAPTITSTAGTTATEDTLYTYTATVSDPDDANNGTDLTWSLSGEPAGMVVSSTGVVTWTPLEGVTTSGAVTLTVSDGNEDGAVDATEVFTITVTPVNDAPTITSTAPTTATEDTLYTYTATVSDPDDANNGTDLTWSLSGEPAGMVVSSTGVVTWTPAEGVTTSGAVTLTVSDGNEDGAVDATEVFTITVTPVNDAPTITSTAPTTATEDTLYTYTATVSDPDDANNGTDLTWSLSGEPAGMVVSSTGVVTWTPLEGVTTSGAVTLTVSDGNEDGAVDATEVFTITVTPVNDAPTITSTAGTTATEDTLYTYTATVSDPDDANNGTDLTWSLSGAPAGMVVSSTGVVTWTPLEGVTTSGAVTLTVSDGNEDGAVDATEVFTITVTPVNDAPTITSTAPTTATEDTLYTYTATVSDPDDANNGTDLTWSLSGAPAGMVVSSTGVVTWTPLEGVTTSGAVTLTVSDGNEDGAVDATEVFTITVTPVNDAPTITSTAPTTATEETLYTYTATVSDPDDANNGTDLTWSLSGEPAGMVVSSTGVVTWTPAEGVTTSGAVTLTVSDGNEDGAVDGTEVFTITVTPVNDAPTITSTAGTTATEDTLYTYTATVNDPDDANNGTDLTWSLSGAPAGMVVSSTGVVTWTPAEGVTSSGPVTLTVSDGNEDGAVDATEVFTVTVTPVNDAPTITSTAGKTATEDTLYTYTATVNDPDDANNGTDLTWSLSGAPAGMVVSSTGVVTWTPTVGVTSSGPVTLTVSDGNEDGAVDATEVFTITVTPVNVGPTITSTAGTTATEDTLYTYTAAVSDPDDANNGTDLTWSLSGAPAGMVVSSTGVVTWTPAEGVTSSGPVTLTVSDGNEDGAVDATEVFTITVTPVNDDPTLNSAISDQMATEDSAFSFTFATNTFGDVDAGDTLTYTAKLSSGAALPTWLTFDGTSRTFSGTPLNGDVGTVSINVFADDGNGDNPATENFVIVVEEAPNASPTGTVTVSGTPAEEEMLVATNTLADSDGLGAISYQWQRDGTDIAGATGDSYFLGQIDVGTSIAVIATYTDGRGHVESVSSNAVGTVANVNDIPEGVPLIAGIAQEEQILAADITGIADDDGLGEISYAWQRSTDNGLTWSVIGMADTYQIHADDVGNAIRVEVSYIDAGGTGETIVSSHVTPMALALSTPPAEPQDNDPGLSILFLPVATDENEPKTSESAEPSDATGVSDAVATAVAPANTNNASDGDGNGEREAKPAEDATQETYQEKRLGGSTRNAPAVQMQNGEAIPENILALIEASAPDVDNMTEENRKAEQDAPDGRTGIALLTPGELHRLQSSQNIKLEMQHVKAVLNNPAMWRDLDAMKDQIENRQPTPEQFVVAVASTTGAGLMAGLVAYTLRGGALLASLLSTMPLWRAYDPLPILSSGYKKAVVDEEENALKHKAPEDASKVEALFE